MRNDDLISRKALLKKFAHPPELIYTNVVLDEIRTAPIVGGWISAKDELPQVGDLVLFTGLSSFGTRFITQRGWFDGTFWKRDAGETVDSNTPVTHWMPLPEPPKEG